MQQDGNIVIRYSREHCLLPGSVTITSNNGGGSSTIPSSSTRMVSTVKGFEYLVGDETNVILYPKIEEYSMGISNTENNPGDVLVVTDLGQIVVRDGVSSELHGSNNKVLWKRG